jgi:hypothetical protein
MTQLLQKNRRIRSHSTNGNPATGASATRRSYRL